MFKFDNGAFGMFDSTKRNLKLAESCTSFPHIYPRKKVGKLIVLSFIQILSSDSYEFS